MKKKRDIQEQICNALNIFIPNTRTIHKTHTNMRTNNGNDWTESWLLWGNMWRLYSDVFEISLDILFRKTKKKSKSWKRCRWKWPHAPSPQKVVHPDLVLLFMRRWKRNRHTHTHTPIYMHNYMRWWIANAAFQLKMIKCKHINQISTVERDIRIFVIIADVLRHHRVISNIESKTFRYLGFWGFLSFYPLSKLTRAEIPDSITSAVRKKKIKFLAKACWKTTAGKWLITTKNVKNHLHIRKSK